MPASSNAQTKQNDADKDNAELGTIASSNAQEKKKKKFPQCLVAYTATSFFSVPSFPFLMTLFTLYSSQISLVLTKLFLCLLLSFTHGNNHGFFLGQKLLQSITLSPCNG